MTYHRDVAPILQNRCVECHRPGEIGPFSLATFERARAKSKTIREVVAERRMPPWFAHPDHGTWENDRHLTAAEIGTLSAWVDAGAPEGNPKDAPTPREWTEGWAIGKPDQVWQLPSKVKVPAEGTIPYRYVRVRTGLKEDRWVQAYQIRPSVREAVHHILVFVLYPFNRLREQPKIDGGLLNGYFAVMVPGERPVIYPEGMGKYLPAGSSLLFQIHYTAFGKEVWDRSKFGVVFAKKRPKHVVITRGIINKKIQIPPGAANHPEKALYTFKRDARILGFLPHMHVRGKSFRYTAIHSEGREEILLDVPRYDFNWQLYYKYAEPKPVKKGTKIRALAHFDNSKDNPANPDPSKRVRYGEQTWEEMLNGYVDFIED